MAPPISGGFCSLPQVIESGFVETEGVLHVDCTPTIKSTGLGNDKYVKQF